MQLAGGHVFRCVIGRFAASISLLGIEVGGAADEIICCPIDSELAIVKYGSIGGGRPGMGGHRTTASRRLDGVS